VKNYLELIETNLGDWKRLPEYPFYDRSWCYAIFSEHTDYMIDEKLYEAIFDLNRELGNSNLICKSLFDNQEKKEALLIQHVKNWAQMDSFQFLDLVNLGFYVAGNKLNWLGIYHRDDYLIIGAPIEQITMLVLRIYGHLDWQQELIKMNEEGSIDIYEEDFAELRSILL